MLQDIASGRQQGSTRLGKGRMRKREGRGEGSGERGMIRKRGKIRKEMVRRTRKDLGRFGRDCEEEDGNSRG